MALVLDFKVNDKATPEIKKLQAQLKQLNPVISNTDKGFLGLNKSMMALGASYVSFQAIKGVTTSFIRQADAMTNVHSKLLLVTDSTYALNKAQQEIFKTSQETRTSFTANVDLYSKMALSTKELALSQKELLDITGLINKSMIISGTSAEGTTTLVTQLGQAFSSNFQAVAQELGTIRDQAPALYQSLLKGTGMTTAEFKKAAEQGKLSSKIIIEALKSQNIEIDKDFKKMKTTVGQASIQLSNSMGIFIGKMDDATGFSGTLATSLTSLSGFISDMASDATLAEIAMNDYAESINNASNAALNFESTKITKEIARVSKLANEEARKRGAYAPVSGYGETLAYELTALSQQLDIIEKQKKALTDISKIDNEATSVKTVSGESKEDRKSRLEFQKQWNESEAEDRANIQIKADLRRSLDKDYIEKALQMEADELIAKQAAYDLEMSWQEDLHSNYIDMLDTQISLIESTNSWGNSFEGVAGQINDVAKTFSKFRIDELRATKEQAKLDDKYSKQFSKYAGDEAKTKELLINYDNDSAKIKEQQTANQIDGYANLAGAMSASFEQGSMAAKAFAVIQGGLAIVSAGAGGDPYTVVPRMAAAAAMVYQTLSESGISSGSGAIPLASGSNEAASATSFAGLNQVTTNYGAVDFDSFVDGVDNAVDALKQFGNIGSAVSESIISYKKQIDAKQADINTLTNNPISNVSENILVKLFGQRYDVISLTDEGKAKIQKDIDKLNQEIADVYMETLADGLDFDRFTLKEINNIIPSDFNLDKYNEVLDEINDLALKAKQGTSTSADAKKLSDLTAVGSIWEIGQDYSDAVSLISDALETSKDNIKEWTDSFKTSDELLSDMATSLGSNIALTKDELDALFVSLSGGVDGLNDSELEFLNANKKVLDDEQKSIDDAVSNFKSAMSSMADSIDNTINSIKGNMLSDSELNSDQIQRLGMTQLSFESAVKRGDTKNASEYLNELTALSSSVSSGAFGDAGNLNQNLITQLEANKAMIDFSDEVLNVRIVASDIDATSTTSTPSVYVTNSTNNDDRLATLEAIMIEVLKTNNNVYDTLLRIKNDGLKAL